MSNIITIQHPAVCGGVFALHPLPAHAVVSKAQAAPGGWFGVLKLTVAPTTWLGVHVCAVPGGFAWLALTSFYGATHLPTDRGTAASLQRAAVAAVEYLTG